MECKSPASLLILGHLPAEIKRLCHILEAEGYTVACFTSPGRALTALREQSFDLVLTDLLMPKMNGLTFLGAAFEIEPGLVGIVMSKRATVSAAVAAMQAGALDYILKPFNRNVILPVLARALRIRTLRLENTHLLEALGSYGRSMAIGFAHGFNSVIEKVADAAIGQRQVRGVSILLPAEGNKELQVVVARGEAPEGAVGTSIPFTRELSAWVAQGLEIPVQPDNLVELPHLLAEAGGSTFIPMMAGGKFVGILNFNLERSRRPAAPGRIKALNVLASASATALEAASLIEQLRLAEERYRGLSQNAPDLVFRYELLPQPRFSYINRAITSVTGYSPEEDLADPDFILKVVNANDLHLMKTLLGGGFSGQPNAPLRCIHRHGNEVWIEQRNRLVHDQAGRLIAVEGIASDITRRRQLEEQLRQAQKLEAMGLLAAGVAHDFNNLLTVIAGYTDLILADDVLSHRLAERVGHIQQAAEQAGGLTRQLLAFGRKQVIRSTALNINKTVRKISRFLKRIVGGGIELITNLEAGIGNIQGQDSQIEQILMNLAVNARDAMPAGGTVTIETHNIGPEEAHAGDAVTLAPGPHVMLSVSDTGCGMNELAQARIFQPFYTTKEPGMGTGLGLSIVHGIVEQNGGHIRVVSKPGHGARFEIFWPRTEDQEEHPASDGIPKAAPLLKDGRRGIAAVVQISH